jgi:hypothetical protein
MLITLSINGLNGRLFIAAYIKATKIVMGGLLITSFSAFIQYKNQHSLVLIMSESGSTLFCLNVLCLPNNTALCAGPLKFFKYYSIISRDNF